MKSALFKLQNDHKKSNNDYFHLVLNFELISKLKIN
jgi:hypothetical protein